MKPQPESNVVRLAEPQSTAPDVNIVSVLTQLSGMVADNTVKGLAVAVIHKGNTVTTMFVTGDESARLLQAIRVVKQRVEAYHDDAEHKD